MSDMPDGMLESMSEAERPRPLHDQILNFPAIVAVLETFSRLIAPITAQPTASGGLPPL